MSTVYNLEPPTKGKVILRTTLGDLEACRNFVQMCMEGYYNNTIFHRIIKDYLIQGSESIYGELFKDEFHTRLKFTHRGLVACANQNRPNSNGSQFFITLEKTEWLERQNTIFGRVVGDTIYNLLRIGECATDEGDRPLEPPVLKEVEVAWNPFDDIVPRRDRAREREEAKRAEAAAAAAAAKRGGPKKNLGLLSFGEEAEEEELQQDSVLKIRSAHDALDDRRLAKEDETPAEERIFVERPAKRSKEDDEKVAKAISHARSAMESAARDKGGRLQPPSAAEGKLLQASKGSVQDFGSAMHERMMERRRQMGDDAPAEGSGRAGEGGVAVPGRQGGLDDLAEGRVSDGEEEEEEEEGMPKDFRSERQGRIDALKMDNKRKGIGRMNAPDAVENADLLKPWQLAREKYKQRKRLVGDREKATLNRLKQFSQTLKAPSGNGSAPSPASAPGSHIEEPSTVGEDAGYSGKVRTDIDHEAYLPPSWRVDDYLDREDLDVSLTDLRSHRLSFARQTGRVDDMARNVTDNIDDYVVFDPLLEKGKGKFSKAAQKEKKRQNEWSGKANQ